ncbi:hypothetical protein [Brachybacterium kimchii]|uniref:Uncharacterized protein n=1 Tax=Brachybacterium kimchii TaxID=2942909 RepID=A0ABY4N7I5_9MICO|nr:hypothetical protein [Brachybacterium kimchii]UQN30523.1 hypothetical protein M4486_04220 [Brachybacterium kimchii]
MSIKSFSRMLNGRVCLNERCSQPLPEGKSSCVRHAFASGRNHDDPLDPHSDDVLAWWERSAPRRRKLETLQASPPGTLVLQLASWELERIRTHMAVNLVELAVAAWRAESASQGWRLPPDGWILQRIRDEHPDIGLQSTHRAPQVPGFEHVTWMDGFIDRAARVLHADRNPAPAPFRPLTERRRTDEDAVSTLSLQDQKNAQVLGDHAEGLHAAKHDNARAAIKEIFAHPQVDTEVPEGMVVFHQIVDPVGMTTIYSAERDRWSFARHMQLEAGDVVRYDHARSATLAAGWLGNLGKTTGDPVGLNSGAPETMLRLELAPMHGLYVGDALCDLAQSHLSAELEVILPGDTIWEVVAVVDAEHPVDWRHGSRDYKRLRTIQMIEIGADDVRSARPLRMTATSAELDALSQDLS